MREPRWLERLHAALRPARGSGSPVSTARAASGADGRYVGRTIVHASEEAPLAPSRDGGRRRRRRLPLPLAATVLDAVGGFDEDYGFFHGYDRDLSFAVREAGTAARWSARHSSTTAAAPARGSARPAAPPRTSPTAAPPSRASPRSGAIGCRATCAR